VHKENISRKLFQRTGALLDLGVGATLQQAAIRAGVNYNIGSSPSRKTELNSTDIIASYVNATILRLKSNKILPLKN